MLFTIDEIRPIIQSKMLSRECLSEIYNNSFSPLSWRCSEWNASFKNNKTWCPYCATNRPCTLEQLYYGCVIKIIDGLLLLITLNIQTHGAHSARNIKEKSYVMRF